MKRRGFAKTGHAGHPYARAIGKTDSKIRDGIGPVARRAELTLTPRFHLDGNAKCQQLREARLR
jgi:hypothetical protein